MKSVGMALAMLSTALAIVLAFGVAEAGPTDEPWVHFVSEAVGTGLFVLVFLGSAALFRKAATDRS